jgi:hypothetical protein
MEKTYGSIVKDLLSNDNGSENLLRSEEDIDEIVKIVLRLEHKRNRTLLETAQIQKKLSKWSSLRKTCNINDNKVGYSFYKDRSHNNTHQTQVSCNSSYGLAVTNFTNFSFSCLKLVFSLDL